VCGSEEGSAVRCYRQEIGARPEPITATGFSGAWVAPDGRAILLQDVEAAWHKLTIEGGQIEPVVGLTARDTFIAWSGDSRAIYVQRQNGQSARVERLDLATGARHMVIEVHPPDVSGVISTNVTDFRDNGTYAYWYWKRPGTLFLVSDNR
jgi:hypothetical protein